MSISLLSLLVEHDGLAYNGSKFEITGVWNFYIFGFLCFYGVLYLFGFVNFWSSVEVASYRDIIC